MMKPRYSRALIIVPVILFLVLNLSVNVLYRPFNLDHWAYMLMSRAVLEGSRPYADFFFASPPVFIYATAVFFALFGIGLEAAKLFTLVVGTIAILTYAVMCEREKRGLGLVAPLLLVSTHIFHRTSGIIVGTSMTLIPIFISTFLMLKKEEVKSGVVSGLAFVTRINSLLSSLSLLIFSALRERWRGYLKGALLFLPVFLALLLIPGFFLDTLWYHLAKTSLPTWKMAELELFFMEQYALLIAFIVSLVPVFVHKHYERPLILISLLNILLNAAYFLITSTFFIHYFIFLVPFVCIITGYVLVDTCERSGRNGKILGILMLLLITGLSVLEVPRLQKSVNPAYGTLEKIILEESDVSDGLIDFSVSTIPPYLAFVTGRQTPLDYIDSSFQRIEKYVNMSDFLEEVSGVEFVLWNLKDSPYRLHEGYSEVAEYIRENFYPRFIFFEVGDIFILWKRGSNEPLDTVPVFEGTYNVKYLKAYEDGNAYYGYARARLSPGSVYPRYECIPCLVNVTGDKSIEMSSRIIEVGENGTLAEIKLGSIANYGGLRLLASNHSLMFPGKTRWSTDDGSLISDSWVTNHAENYTEMVTLTRENESIRSIVFVQYSNPRRKYVYLVALQPIGGIFAEVYKERVD